MLQYLRLKSLAERSAGIGGVLRNSKGGVLCSFSAFIGHLDAIAVEIYAITTYDIRSVIHSLGNTSVIRIPRTTNSYADTYLALRPTMSEVVSMLKSQTIVQEAVSDPGIYGNDLQIKQIKGYYQRLLSTTARS
ncbi:hypothetical protein QYF36_019128 [Acer negundo]|nr:hypothetical protein QYF36_019128 [Acer negundo]